MHLHNIKLAATAVILAMLAAACGSGQNTDSATTNGSESLASQPTALPQTTDIPEIVAQDESADSTSDRPEADVLSSDNSPQPDPDNSEIFAITNPDIDTPTDLSPDPAPPPTSSAPPADESDTSNDVVSKAQQFLAAELGVTEEEITLTNTEAVTWSDGSLGCMQDGYAYTQAETPGFRLTFSHNNNSYVVHSNESGSYFIRPLNCI